MPELRVGPDRCRLHEVQGWMKPVKFLLLDKEVPIYQDTMTIRADKLDANRACLQKLVPLMQQAAIDYVHNPGPVNGLIVDYGPVFSSRGKDPKPGLQASDLFTNEYLDKNIKL